MKISITLKRGVKEIKINTIINHPLLFKLICIFINFMGANIGEAVRRERNKNDGKKTNGINIIKIRLVENSVENE